MLQKISLATLCVGFLLWMLTTPTRIPLLTLVAILIHEAGHLIAAYLLHMKPSGISADTVGVRLLFRGTPPSYKKEILLCVSGPLANLISLLAVLLFKIPDSTFFVSASAALAFLNLLPIDSFDGGRIAHSTLLLLLPPTTADTICEFLSFLFLFVLWCISVYLMMRASTELSLFFFSSAIFFRIFLQKKPI